MAAHGLDTQLPEIRDELVRSFARDASVSVRVLVATNLVREAARRHETAPTASVALGRALMGTLLLASEMQDGERVQVRIRGDGPLGAITVTASSEGEVRGYAQRPATDLPARGDRPDVAGAVGLGSLSVERNHPSWKQPYSGVVPLVSGELAKDFAAYLLESEQKPSAMALGVYLGRDGAVEAAGGYLVQGLPGASDASLAEMERHVAALPNLSERLRAGAGADAILGELLGELAGNEVSRLEPRFRCPCGPERVRRAVVLLGRDEIRDIVRRGEPVEVRCAFCAELYSLAADEVGSLVPDA